MTFKHTKKWYFWAKWIAKITGCVLCVFPALLATIINFPVMITENVDSTLSIPFFFAIVISLAVVLQTVIKSFKNNTLLAVAVVMAFITALFIIVYNMEKETIKGLAWVAGSSTIGIFLGVLCFKLYYMWDDLYKHCGEVYVK